MPLYRNFAHCRAVVKSLLPMLSVEGQLFVETALRHSLLMDDEKEQVFFLNSKLKNYLFDIDEAVTIGFNQYLIKYIKDFDVYVKYHEVNKLED